MVVQAQPAGSGRSRWVWLIRLSISGLPLVVLGSLACCFSRRCSAFSHRRRRSARMRVSSTGRRLVRAALGAGEFGLGRNQPALYGRLKNGRAAALQVALDAFQRRPQFRPGESSMRRSPATTFCSCSGGRRKGYVSTTLGRYTLARPTNARHVRSQVIRSASWQGNAQSNGDVYPYGEEANPFAGHRSRRAVLDSRPTRMPQIDPRIYLTDQYRSGSRVCFTNHVLAETTSGRRLASLATLYSS